MTVVTEAPPARTEILRRLERYYDAVPRSAARTEHMGPLVLFVRNGAGWPYYARPRLAGEQGGPTTVTGQDVRAVRERQRELAIPEAFEWVDETTPSMRWAAREAGLHVHMHPLLALDPEAFTPVSAPEGPVEIRRVEADAEDLAVIHSVPVVAFSTSGTERGSAGTAERDLAAVGEQPEAIEALRGRLRAGRTVMYVAYGPQGPIAAGSHQPVGDTTEIVGVGTLPAYRRGGLGAAVTSALAQDALAGGASLIFLSADSEAVARVYERVGFRRTATAGIAEPPPPPTPPQG
ncbi:GNAT family N-acetyltransferase [Wenjunlia tyrosinilytica]|nr:GNAT family N-acetyltransferase [Wenjunlia tyrosinilytica]